MDSDMFILYIVAVSLMFLLIVILLLTRRHTTYNVYPPHTRPHTDLYPFPMLDVDNSYTPMTLYSTPPTIPDETHPSNIYLEMEPMEPMEPMYSNYPFSRSNSYFRGSEIYFSDE